MQFKTALVLVLLVASVVPFVPGAAAETVTKTWTQTSQIDFAQGSGDADVYSSQGSVLPGGGLSTNVGAAWTTDRDAGCSNWCFDRYQTGSPYVVPGKGSIYIGRGWYYPSGSACCYRSNEDRISTPAPGQSQFTVFLYPSSCYQDRWQDTTYINQNFRISDANGNVQDTLLRGCSTNSWSSYREYYGPYSSYENRNGWNWYKFDISVPSHFDKASLRAGLHLQSYTTTCWSCYSQIYMWNYIAFGAPPTSTFVSNVHDAGGLANWGAVNIDGYVPAGASMKLQTRTSGDGTAFSEWASALSGEPVQSPAGRYVQYRALFTRASGGAEPRLDEVRISYSFTLDTNPPRTSIQLVGTQGCAGWYVKHPFVVLTAQDDLSGVAATFLSLDGGLFQRYTEPVKVGDGAHTADFYSVDGAGNVETQRSLGFKVDATVPATELAIDGPTFQGDRLYVMPDTAFSLEASDATSGVKATRVDTGAGLAAYAGAFSLGSGDGARVIDYQSEDAACNVEPMKALGVFVDGSAPIVAITEPEPASFNLDGRRSQDVALPPEVREKLGELDVLQGEDLDAVADILIAGAYEVCGPVLVERCALVALAEMSPRLGGAILAGTVNVSADAFDPVVNGGASGLAGVAFVVDGEVRHADNAAPFAWSWDTRGESLGRHVLSVVAVDNLGNAASAEQGVSVIPLGAAGVLASGAAALDAAGSPDFAQALYEFARAKAEAQQPPEPPSGLPVPDAEEVVEAVRDQLEALPLPPLPVEPPGGLPPVEPGPVPPLPQLPQVCLGTVCTPA